MVISRYSEMNKLGPRGEKGERGEAGIPGDAGPVGFNGEIGPRGDKGDKGDKGEVGDAGDKGQKGEDGPIGYDGDRGDRGSKGDKGPQGKKGETGENGSDGKDGEAGPRGPKGNKGPRGDAGDKGPQGPTGPPGYKGDKGRTGSMGPKGPSGDKGFKGERGDMGQRGPRGDKGLTGPSGNKGEIGPSGDKGPSGKNNCDIVLPSVIMMEKALNLIKDNNLLCYLMLNSPVSIALPGVSTDDSMSLIESIEFNCVVFPEGAIIPIENVQSINVLFVNENERDAMALKMKAMFQSVKDCRKIAPDTIQLDDNLQPITTGNLSSDYEYIPICNCNNASCICNGKRIDISKYTSYESEYLRKILEIRTMRNRKILKIISGRGEEIGIPYPLKGDVTILESCLGSLALTYTVKRGALESQVVDRFMLSIVSLENVGAVKIL